MEPPVERDGPGVAEGLVEVGAERPQRLLLARRVQVQRRPHHVQILLANVSAVLSDLEKNPDKMLVTVLIWL